MERQAPEYTALDGHLEPTVRIVAYGSRVARVERLLSSAAKEMRDIAGEMEQEATTLRRQRMASKAVTR